MVQDGNARLDPRVRLCLRFKATPRWKGATCVEMETLDLSATGLACRSPINLPLKTQIGIVLALPALKDTPATRLRCEAVVVNSEHVGRAPGEWRAGLYFLDLSASDRELLRRFVFMARDTTHALEDAALARGQGGI